MDRLAGVCGIGWRRRGGAAGWGAPRTARSRAKHPRNTRRDMAAMVASLASAVHGFGVPFGRAHGNCGTPASNTQQPDSDVVAHRCPRLIADKALAAEQPDIGPSS